MINKNTYKLNSVKFCLSDIKIQVYSLLFKNFSYNEIFMKLQILHWFVLNMD